MAGGFRWKPSANASTSRISAPAISLALLLSRGLFPGRHFRALSLPRRVGRGLRSLLGRDTPISLPDEARKHHRSNPDSLLDLGLLAGDLGLNRHVQTRLYGRHEAYALLALADAPGPTTRWSSRRIRPAVPRAC